MTAGRNPNSPQELSPFCSCEVADPCFDSLTFPFVTDRDLPARSADQMQSCANGPSTFLERLGAVVVPVDGPCGQEVRQTRQRLRNIVARGIEHSLLGGAVGSSRTWQLGSPEGRGKPTGRRARPGPAPLKRPVPDVHSAGSARPRSAALRVPSSQSDEQSLHPACARRWPQSTPAPVAPL